MALNCALDMHKGVPHFLEDGTCYGYFCHVCDVETEKPVERGIDVLGRTIKWARKKD